MIKPSLLPNSCPHHLPYIPLLGAHVSPEGVHFRLFSRHATRVWLMLFDKADAAKPTQEFELDPKTHRLGDVWHVFVPKAEAGQFYLYRLDGRAPEGIAQGYDPQQWVLDPYAQAVSGSPTWGDPFGIKAGRFPKHGASFPKGVVVQDAFDWSGDCPPRTPLADSIIYEAHVRGYTRHESASTKFPGTYRGFMDQIPYLKELGVTAVEFLPLHEFNEMEYHGENDQRKHLRNYWGYSTVAFFAPNARYAQAGVQGQQVREFKELVKALHQAGIEVILDVVFNHTVEGGPDGPVYSFRGIDPSIYYMIEPDGKTYRNFSGCGNTVNCNHPIVRQLIIDSLRHWVTEYHIDGFRFDLASVFSRDEQGEVMAHPPLLDLIAQDPLLSGCKLIAEAWDAAGLYQVGSFPHPAWSEWNGRYRDDTRAFWASSPGRLSALATRLAGSGDLYDRPGQSPLKSINFITSHDGFTLADLVSYNNKHNLANGEDNRDGDNHNHSYNHGEEGPTDNPHIRGIRKRQVKNFIATLMLSQGVPMLTAGDEFFRTQQGNNNAYCQDNEISWIDWALAQEHADLVDFTRQAIAFRKEHPSLRRRSFLKGCIPEVDGCDILWVGADGKDPLWDTAECLGCILNGAKQYTGADKDKEHLLLLFNGGEQRVDFLLPDPPGRPWKVGLTTEETEPHWSTDRFSVQLDGRSVTVLVSQNQ